MTDRTIENAQEIAKSLLSAGIRAEADIRSEKLGKKIREAQLEKVNYILVVGDKEAEQGVVAVRHRAEGDLGTMTLDAFKAKVLLETAERRRDK